MSLISDIAILIAGWAAVITLLKRYKQTRSNTIFLYYDKTQEIREKLDNLEFEKHDENKEKDEEIKSKKAKSLLRRMLNLYEAISYAILNNTVDEKDAYDLLKKNIFEARGIYFPKHANLRDYKFLDKLYNRWEGYGLSIYWIKNAWYKVSIGLVCFFVLWLILRLTIS